VCVSLSPRIVITGKHAARSGTFVASTTVMLFKEQKMVSIY